MMYEGNQAPCRVLILCVTFIVFIVTSSGALAPFRAGKFSNSAITELAGNLGGEFGAHLGWFADTAQLFTFKGHDGLPLQGYYIPAPISSLSADPLPVLIHCAGWSETSLKYSKFLRILHTEGYPIYSFDLRGQGFSSATGTDVTTSLINTSGRQLAVSCPLKIL
jgi:pimeloyl-ACP methyl ester carboxylesterase